jgi:LysM repeat protein
MKLTILSTAIFALAQAAPAVGDSGILPINEFAAVEAVAYAPPETYGETKVSPTDETAYVGKTASRTCDGKILTIVEEGDTLNSIAQANNLNLDKLIAANPQFSDPDLIYPTDEVCVPKACYAGGYLGPSTGPYPGGQEEMPPSPILRPPPIDFIEEMPVLVNGTGVLANDTEMNAIDVDGLDADAALAQFTSSTGASGASSVLIAAIVAGSVALLF